MDGWTAKTLIMYEVNEIPHAVSQSKKHMRSTTIRSLCYLAYKLTNPYSFIMFIWDTHWFHFKLFLIHGACEQNYRAVSTIKCADRLVPILLDALFANTIVINLLLTLFAFLCIFCSTFFSLSYIISDSCFLGEKLMHSTSMNVWTLFAAN